MKVLRPATALSLILLTVTALPLRHVTAAAPSRIQSIEPVTLYATTSPLPAGGAQTDNPSAHADTNLLKVNRPIPRLPKATNAPTPVLPAPAGNGIAPVPPVASGFNGLTNREQELAGTGQYTLSQPFLEPPDQGLCVGNGSVLEVVNVALQVDSTSGAPASGITPLNQFFRLPPSASRTNPTIFGPDLSDPKCYYDTDLGRWFLTVLEIGVDPATGAFTNTAAQLIAVSQSSDPLGIWYLYRFSTTDDGTGGTQTHPGCPCFGDQPLMGADKNGFYVSTNEFSILGTAFNGTQLYALSKAQLANGTASQVVHLNVGALPTPDQGGIWYSVQPATSPEPGQFETANNGTEYFLSALDFTGFGDNRIATWALMNTASLDSGTPSLRLRVVIVGSETYVGLAPGGRELAATQKPGPIPLATFFNFYFHTNNGLELLQANDDRMNQVVFSAGKLWSGVNTAENGIGVSTNVGIAYFIVTPSSAGGTLSATMTNQGYVSAGRDNVIFPSIGVTPSGKGVMSFTLSGPDFYPSAAYALVDATNGAGNIHASALGAKPEDGFTGYNSPICPPQVCNNQVGARWGDYSAAVSDEQGNVWLGTEYIPNLSRLFFANWGSFITQVTP
ncbi:MAG TPA: hypothetical protein VFE42_01660 [Chloroflexota bacterium]|nr:hypothetical protein [Chloroflexota bacterium]